MAAQLHFDGYYCFGPVAWQDWHAGVRMHGVQFHYTRYYADGSWLGCFRDHEFDFWEFAESVTPELFAKAKRGSAPRTADADPLCTAGFYDVDGDILTKVLEPSDWAGGMSWEFKYRILDDRLVSTNSDGSDRAELFRPKQLSRRVASP
jgi:hypothetical protein